ncbi:response regulator [Novosphingobium terrae]|uniref:response regulator n=1 Tax=Novosphingobium terrae TaxID=2726189 RepID=UPI00197D0B12|nr:response regulator transcription factor [Novosphingobium terrae]
MSLSPHILIVDDDRDIREMLAAYLTHAGCRVFQAADAAQARQLLVVQAISLVLLDVMLPGEDGISLAEFIRSTSAIPVILVTARTEESDRILGLNAGGDDYVTKPFSPAELHARIRAVLRRTGDNKLIRGGEASAYGFGSWVLRTGRRELVDAEAVVTPLPKSEYNLLHALVTHPHQVLTRDQLLTLSEGPDAVLFDRSIDNKISRLRRKLEGPQGSPELIRTLWGSGYIFACDVCVL